MNKFIMMVGIVGSGKTTKAHILAEEENAILIESDQYREGLYKDASIQGDNTALFELIHNDIIKSLQNKNNVVLDATNISRKHRVHLLKKLSKMNVYRECVIVATPIEKCIVQNNNRERKVPTHVIERMANNFQVPLLSEGWDTRKILFSAFDRNKYTQDSFIERTRFFDQENPHHRLTLGEHSMEVFMRISDLPFNMELPLWFNVGCILHDNGKEYTKVFKNQKGEDTNFAHYYNHEKRGSYEGLFYGCNSGLSTDEILDMATLIEKHMQLYNVKTEKSKDKLIGEVGLPMYNLLEILHNADKESH